MQPGSNKGNAMTIDIHQARRDHDAHKRAIKAARALCNRVGTDAPGAPVAALSVLGKIDRLRLNLTPFKPTVADRAVCEQLSAALASALSGYPFAAGAALAIAVDVADLHLGRAERAFEAEIEAVLP